MPNEAMERAARAINNIKGQEGFSYEEFCLLAARAAISAYFADVPVSERMVDAGREVPCDSPITGGIVYSTPQEVRAIYKAMCAKHAEELSNV